MAARGRPSAFKPEYVAQAKKLCALGATDTEIADFFCVNVATIYRWKLEHKDFCEAIKVGKDEADDRVERSLYQKAIGYSFASEKIVTLAQGGNQGSVVERVPVTEHVPPSDTAIIFWLKNRRKDDWRDRVISEHTGAGGGPIQTEDKGRLGAALAFALRKGLSAGG